LRNLGRFEQDLPERPRAAGGGASRVLHDLMRLLPVQGPAECRHDGLAHRHREEVGPHPPAVDLEALEQLARGRGRTSGQVEKLGQRLPFGLPAARRSFVFLHHRGQDGCHEAGAAGGAGQNRDGADRIALLRHGRGSPAGLVRRFTKLTDLVLGQEHHILSDLAHRAQRHAQSAGQLGRAIADGVPGRDWHGQVELSGEVLHHLNAAVTQRRQRSHRPAKLDRKTVLGHPTEAPVRAVEPGQPGCRLQPEGDRRPLLKQRAAGHHQVAVGIRQVRACLCRSTEIFEQGRQRPAGDQHARAVDDVLAGRPAMQMSRRRSVRVQPGADGREQRRNRRPGCCGAATQLIQIQPLGVGDERRKLLDRRSGRQSGTRQRPEQSELDLQHRLCERSLTQQVLGARHPLSSSSQGERNRWMTAAPCGSPVESRLQK
jgi:hypothetical protein